MPVVMTGAVGVGVAVRHKNGHMTLNMVTWFESRLRHCRNLCIIAAFLTAAFKAVIDSIIAVYWPFAGHS